MARWRLRQPHYLNVPGTQWEYKEVTREGKQARLVLDVPLHLDPALPADQNYPGDVIVCYKGKGDPRDIVFVGEPTPDMEPLDTEAEEISKSFSHKWVHPIEDMSPDGGYGASLIRAFEQQIAKLTESIAPNASLKGVSNDDLEVLKKQIEALTQKNVELEARLDAPPKASRRA